jgi:hypothetical protein
MGLERPASVIRFFVGGVGTDATGPQLCAAFAEVGVALKHVELVANRATGFKRGFDFVYVDSSPTGPTTTLKGVLERMGGVTVNGRESSARFISAPPVAPLFERSTRPWAARPC